MHLQLQLANNAFEPHSLKGIIIGFFYHNVYLPCGYNSAIGGQLKVRFKKHLACQRYCTRRAVASRHVLAQTESSALSKIGVASAISDSSRIFYMLLGAGHLTLSRVWVISWVCVRIFSPKSCAKTQYFFRNSAMFT